MKKPLIWFGTFALLTIYINIEGDGTLLSGLVMAVICLIGSYLMHIMWGVYWVQPVEQPAIIMPEPEQELTEEEKEKIDEEVEGVK